MEKGKEGRKEEKLPPPCSISRCITHSPASNTGAKQIHVLMNQ